MRRLLMIVVAEVGAVALTQRLAQPHWAALQRDPAGVVQAPAGDLVISVVHLAAWLSAWWLLLGTGHDLLAVVAELRHGRAVRGPRFAPVWVQRILHRAVGTVLVMGVMAGPASAATGTSPSRPAEVAQVVAPPVPIVGLPTSDEGATPAEEGNDARQQGPAVDGAADQSAAGAEQPTADADHSAAEAEQPAADGTAEAVGEGAAAGETGVEGDVHVVAAGENLWVIARQHLSAASPQAPSDREVHAHWIRLIQANADGLRSGDPDRIFPGERLHLPPPADPEAIEGTVVPTGETQERAAGDQGEAVR